MMLARDLGYRTVADLLDTMDTAEFTRWKALYLVEQHERKTASRR